MKVLFIGGTGLISVEVSKLVIKRGIDLYLLNRGQRNITIDGAKSLVADINNIGQVEKVLEGHHFDCIVNCLNLNGLNPYNAVRITSNSFNLEQYT